MFKIVIYLYGKLITELDKAQMYLETPKCQLFERLKLHRLINKFRSLANKKFGYRLCNRKLIDHTCNFRVMPKNIYLHTKLC